MIGVLLAAGSALRMRPLTDRVPKALLPVGGVTLLERTLRHLRHHGVRRTVIVTGYLHEMIQQCVRNLPPSMDVKCLRNRQYDTTANTYSLWLAGEEVAGKEMVLLDADILFAPEILRRLLDSPHENAVVVRPDPDLGSEEVKVAIDPHGMIRRIGKEVPPEDSIGESVGIEKFSADASGRLFQILEERKDSEEFYEASFQKVIESGVALYTVTSAPFPCIEIDTPSDLAIAEQLAFEYRL